MLILGYFLPLAWTISYIKHIINGIEEWTIKSTCLDYQLSLQLKKGKPTTLKYRVFSSASDWSLQYISTNVVNLLVKLTNTTALTYSALAPTPMFLSFPPNPPEVCPVLQQDCADRLALAPIFPCRWAVLNSAKLFVLHPKLNKNEGSTQKSTKKYIKSKFSW